VRAVAVRLLHLFVVRIAPATARYAARTTWEKDAEILVRLDCCVRFAVPLLCKTNRQLPAWLGKILVSGYLISVCRFSRRPHAPALDVLDRLVIQILSAPRYSPLVDLLTSSSYGRFEHRTGCAQQNSPVITIRTTACAPGRTYDANFTSLSSLEFRDVHKSQVSSGLPALWKFKYN